MNIEARCLKVGDNINTDEIIPARYLNTSDPAELAKYVMEDLDPNFKTKLKGGDILIAGSNFGCGSSREHAPIAIKWAEISMVIASSFARIFYRNAINMGLRIVECPEAVADAEEGHRIVYNSETGLIRNIDLNREYETIPYPPFIQELIDSGGLMAWVAAGK
jgi:3-isopropylmalate/(R)-2-methylmalate dehydratase small subunit